MIGQPCACGAGTGSHLCQCTPVAPPPPTENARAGADAHDEIARIFVTGWVPGFSRESRERMISQLASQLRGARMEGEAAGRARGLSDRLTENWDPNQAVPRVIREAWEAGRARGIEEERQRCEGIAREKAAARRACADRMGSVASSLEHLEEVSVQKDLAADCDAIADAIAKEG